MRFDGAYMYATGYPPITCWPPAEGGRAAVVSALRRIKRYSRRPSSRTRDLPITGLEPHWRLRYPQGPWPRATSRLRITCRGWPMGAATRPGNLVGGPQIHCTLNIRRTLGAHTASGAALIPEKPTCRVCCRRRPSASPDAHTCLTARGFHCCPVSALVSRPNIDPAVKSPQQRWSWSCPGDASPFAPSCPTSCPSSAETCLPCLTLCPGFPPPKAPYVSSHLASTANLPIHARPCTHDPSWHHHSPPVLPRRVAVPGPNTQSFLVCSALDSSFFSSFRFATNLGT